MVSTLAERRELYHSRKEDGCCPRCGKKVKKSGSVFCVDCLGFYREYTEEHKQETNAKRTLLYVAKLENKICPRCGVKLRKSYAKKLCRNCLDKAKGYSAVKKKKQSTLKSVKKTVKPAAAKTPKI
jgi:NMD protein affecting ribosome stability and mRNA decay